MYSKKPKALDYYEVLAKLKHYCAYQERCYYDVEKKMKDFELSEDEQYELIKTLRAENYLNEERFVTSFCRGKFKIKKWGRNKIRTELKRKKIPESLISIGMMEIGEEDYLLTLSQLIEKNADRYGNFDNRKNQLKLANYLINKGYENGLVWERIGKFRR